MKLFLHSNRRKYFANDFDFDPVFFTIQAHLWSCDSCIYCRREGKGLRCYLGLLAGLAILHQDELKNRLICTLFFIFFITSCIVQISQIFTSSWCKKAGAARNGINSVPQEAATTFTFSSV